MDVPAILHALNEEQSKHALGKFLRRFLDPAFGALPKGEVDLLVLELLEDIGAIHAEPAVYELVSKLKVTRSKARNLLYERELRRLSSNELDYRVRSLLKRPIIQKSGELFILEVENPLVSDHLRDRVQKLGYVSDGSFSPSLVKLSLDAITAVIKSYLSEVEQNEVRQALIEAGAPDTSVRGVIKSALKRVGAKVAADSGEALMDQATEYLSPIVDGAAALIRERLPDLYQEGIHRN